MQFTKTRLQSILKILAVLFSAIFLSIITISPYIVSSEDIKLIIMSVIIFCFMFVFLLFKLVNYYNKSLYFLISRISNNSYSETSTLLIWVPSSFVAGISSIILFIQNIFIMSIYLTSSSSYMVDYGAKITSLNDKYIPLIVIIYIVLGLAIQVYILKRSKRINYFNSIISSLINIILFIIIIIIIIRIFRAILILF